MASTTLCTVNVKQGALNRRPFWKNNSHVWPSIRDVVLLTFTRGPVRIGVNAIPVTTIVHTDGVKRTIWSFVGYKHTHIDDRRVAVNDGKKGGGGELQIMAEE